VETWSIIQPPPGTFETPMVDVSTITRKFLDIPYASQSSSQKLDIYLPKEGEGPFPTLIFIHGGAFLFGNKQDTQLLQALDGINRGYAVVSVEYRLATEAKFPAGLFDVKAAIRFLRAHAAEYKLDPNRFASCGDSAGGYYVVMAAATQNNPAFEDLSMGWAEYSSAVSAVVSWFGCFDMLRIRQTVPADSPLADPNFPDIDKALLGAPSTDIEGLMYFTNPINFITSDFPPIYVTHGTADVIVSVEQSILLAEKLKAVLPAEKYEVEILEGFNHGGFEMRWNEKEYIDKTFTFLDRFMK
jgi:acetyl esterase/lipase